MTLVARMRIRTSGCAPLCATVSALDTSAPFGVPEYDSLGSSGPSTHDGEECVSFRLLSEPRRGLGLTFWRAPNSRSDSPCGGVGTDCRSTSASPSASHKAVRLFPSGCSSSEERKRCDGSIRFAA